MAVDITITAARDADIDELARNIREADRKEIWLVAMMRPETVLYFELRQSVFAWTGRANGEIVCMFGVSEGSVITGTGMPWMLATDLLTKFQFYFLRRNKTFIDMMSRVFPVLYNYVDVENILAIRWLKWLGFKVSRQPEPWGLMRAPFYRFEMRS